MAKNKLPTILTRRSDFINSYKGGQRVHINSWLVLNVLINDGKGTRIGWTIPKYVGKSVRRNKIKRWFRETVRLHYFFKSDRDLDINFVLKRRDDEFYKKLSNEEVQRALEGSVRRLKKLSLDE